MDIRKFFSPPQKKKIDDEDDFSITTKRKASKCKGVLYDSESSDEEPIPKCVRNQLESSDIIPNSDDESKKAPTKVAKKKTKPAKPVQKKMKETTPGEFFARFPTRSSTKNVEKRKTIEEQPSKSTPSKKLKNNLQDTPEILIVEDDDENLQTTSVTKGKSIKGSLSSKLAVAAAKQKSKANDTKSKAGLKKEMSENVHPEAISKSDAKKVKDSTPKKTASDISSNKSKKASPEKVTPRKKSPLKVEGDSPAKGNKEEKTGDKQNRFLNYQRWQNRAGPPAPGSKEVPQGQDFCFEGLVFVVTGIQESLSRDEIKSLVERYGGKVTTTISRKTSYLITGSDAGETKLKKAEQNKTKIIDEDQFLELIRTLPGKKSKYEINQKPPVITAKTKSTICKEPIDVRVDDKVPSVKPDEPASAMMWVDKYKPTSLKQIIGQQGPSSNAQKLMNWLKKWKFTNRSAEGKARPKPKFNPWGGGDPTGSIFKAALLSGPPGVGKTTTATLVCKELGLPFVEMNASDQRSKKVLKEEVVTSVQNTSISNLFGKEASKDNDEHVLIMDEVDGMAGNEDRGGLQELIQIIKSTKIPIICMCNDRSSPKMRSLVNYCFDLRFQRPRVEQITSAVMGICYKEGVDIQSPAVQAIIRGCNQDVRQVLHSLNMLKASKTSLSYDAAKSHADQTQKNVNIGIFEIARKLLSAESASLSLLDKSDLFFMDYSMVPKFIQENYINVRPFNAKGDIEQLQLLSKASDCIASGDLIESVIRHDQSWSMLPTLGLLSTVLPCDIIRGSLHGMINFPSFFGKLSTTGKNHRLLQELKFHSSIGTSGCTEETMNLDLMPYLRWHLSQPLLRQSQTGEFGVDRATKTLDEYDLTREDFNSLMEVGQFQGKPNYMSQVDSKVKAAFTRTYNKEKHLTPYAVESAVARKKKTTSFETDELEASEQTGTVDDDSDDLGTDGMIKQSKKPAKPAASKSRAKKTKASSSGTSSKKSRK